MAFHNLLDQVGVLGRFQIFQMIFVSLSTAIVYSHVVLENFTAAIPDHRCWVPHLDNAAVSTNDTGALSQGDLLKVFIPRDSNLMPEKCRRFVHPQWQLLHLDGKFSNVTEPDTEPCVDGWVYDQKTFPSTVVTKWDLVCEYQYLKSVDKFLFMTGMLVGSTTLGHLSDRFGRKLLFRLCVLQVAIAETGAAFVPTFVLYCVLRFLTGFCTSNILTNSSMLVLEWMVPRFQALGLAMIICFTSMGNIILGGLAFAFRDWFTLQLMISVPLFVIFLSSRWLVESARWLIINNKLEEGLKALRKVAHRNGVKDTENTLTVEVVRSNMQEDMEAVRVKVSVLRLFRTPNMRKRTCLLCFVRFAVFVPFFGLTLHLQYTGSNIFLSQVLFGAVNFLASFIALFIMNHMGRRVSQILLSVFIGIFIITTTFLPEEMQLPRLAFSTLGVGAASAMSLCSFTHANELMPTVVRATASGILGIASNMGGVLAPLLMILRMYSHHLPWIMYGLFPILSLPAIFLLPETRNQPLPDSIQDVENERKGSREAKQEDTGTSMKVTSF